MTFFARNSSFTVLGTGECVRCNRSLLNIVSCGAKNWFFCCCCCFCFFFFALSPFTFSRASGNLLLFCLNSHWLLVIASLSLIGRCDVFCVGFITRQRKALGWNKCFYFFLSFGHLRVSDGFVLLHKKGASGVLCSLNKGVLLNLSRRGKINLQTGRAVCSVF